MENLFRVICETVDERRDEIVETLKDLVRIPTQSPPGENYDRIVEYLLPLFRAVGLNAQVYNLPDQVFEDRCRRYNPELVGPRSNLLAGMPRAGKPTVAFYTHLDTVPVGDRGRWVMDPFRPVERDGYIWGRGSADSKGGAVAILSALRVLHALEIELAISPLVALTTDEETGPYTGLMHMADTGVFKDCRCFFSCDGAADSVSIGSLGGFTWTIRVRGVSAHSARSFLGLNPIEHSVALLDELVNVKRKIEGRRSRLETLPDLARSTGNPFVSPVLNITVARGGLKHNMVPSEFVLIGDRRYIPEEDEAECVREIEEAVARARARDASLDCTLEIKPLYPGFVNDPNGSWVQRVCRVASKVRGSSIRPTGIPSSTDVGHIAQVTGTSVVCHGVVRPGESNNHGVDERCRVDDVLSLTKIIALLMTSADSDDLAR